MFEQPLTYSMVWALLFPNEDLPQRPCRDYYFGPLKCLPAACPKDCDDCWEEPVPEEKLIPFMQALMELCCIALNQSEQQLLNEQLQQWHRGTKEYFQETDHYGHLTSVGCRVQRGKIPNLFEIRKEVDKV